MYSYCVLVTESHFSPPRAPTLAGTTAADTPQRCEGAGLQGSPRGPNLAELQFREMSIFPGESCSTPGSQDARCGPGGILSLLGAMPARHAVPERAKGVKTCTWKARLPPVVASGRCRFSPLLLLLPPTCAVCSHNAIMRRSGSQGECREWVREPPQQGERLLLQRNVILKSGLGHASCAPRAQQEQRPRRVRSTTDGAAQAR